MPTPDNNKVEFGISNLHVGTYSVSSAGVVSLGTPYHQKGAVSLSLDPESDKSDFFADNIKYWSGYVDNGFSGTVKAARFDTAFKTQFLGYAALSGGAIGKVKTATKPNVYLAFEAEGDAEKRRVLLLNATLGEIKREFATIEDKKEPATEELDINVIGDNSLGLTIVSYAPGDTGYSTLFTEPTMPSIATGSGSS